MRDRADNCVVICSIENLDPMGVHTGDSITVAPAQTLSDVEYQRMRDAAFACIRRVGVETGGSNVQFALNPANGDMVIIEMNPRVSRSSALASKATGFPIAKIAARLAVGYTLDEIANDITRKTPASFEPVIDYVVTKIPRWAFEKFPGTPAVLGTQMQSVGEAMAIGRTFPESLQKGLRSLEHGRLGLNCDPGEAPVRRADRRRAGQPGGHRHPRPSLPARGRPAAGHPGRRPLRRHPRRPLVPRPDPRHRRGARSTWPSCWAGSAWRAMTRRAGGGPSGSGFSDAQLAWLHNQVARRPGHRARRARRPRWPPGVRPTFKTVDTCAAEFEADTPVPLLDLGGRGRGAPERPAQGGHPRLGAQPHRPGHRVRLLLRARQLRPAATPASRRSWSTATPRPCRPTTTPATASTSSRSPTRT